MLIDIELAGFEAPGLSFERRAAAHAIINQIKGKPVTFSPSENDVIDGSKLFTAALAKVNNKIKGNLTYFRICNRNKTVETTATKTYKDAAIKDGDMLILNVFVQ